MRPFATAKINSSLSISPSFRPSTAGTIKHYSPIDHFTVVAKLPGLTMEARLPVTLF